MIRDDRYITEHIDAMERALKLTLLHAQELHEAGVLGPRYLKTLRKASRVPASVRGVLAQREENTES